MVRKLALIGTIISAISIVVILIFGILPLLMGDIDPVLYQQRDQLWENITIISVSVFITRIGLIIIFSSTLLKTNIFLMIGSIGAILVYSWYEINDMKNRFIPTNIYSPISRISGISGMIEFITVLCAVSFAIGSLIYFKRSMLMFTAGALIFIYVFFYIVFFSSVRDLIFGTDYSHERSIFTLIYFYFENVLVTFVGWSISFSEVSESKNKIDLMGTVFNLDSSHVN